MAKFKTVLRTFGGLVGILISVGSSRTPMGYHDSPVLAPSSTKRVMTGWTLTVTRDESLKFNEEAEAKVESFIQTHPSLTDSEKNALRKFHVARSMTKDQIRLLLGDSFEILRSPEKLPGKAKDRWISLSTIDDAWLYRIRSSRFNNALAVIYFKDDRVASFMEYGHYYLLL